MKLLLLPLLFAASLAAQVTIAGPVSVSNSSFGNTAGAAAFTLLCNFSQGLGVNGGTTSTTCNATGAKVIAVGVSGVGASGAATCGTLSDSSSNTYTYAATTYTNAGASPGNALCYKAAPTVSSSMTWTYTLTSSQAGLSVWVWSGGTGALDLGFNNALASGATSLSVCGTTACGGGATFTATHSPALLLTVETFSGATSAVGIDSGFATPQSVPNNPGVVSGISSSYLIQNTAAAVNPTWSWTTSHRGANFIADFY
jgi:hypothetical protein